MGPARPIDKFIEAEKYSHFPNIETTNCAFVILFKSSINIQDDRHELRCFMTFTIQMGPATYPNDFKFLSPGPSGAR